MKTTIERELKFEADDIQIDRLGGEPLEPHTFASSYHDTADRRLLRAGITLRRRVENGKSDWQLKLPRGESRLELEEPGGPAAPPPGLARLLSGILRGSELELIAMLETHRHGRLVEGVEVTIDDVSVLDGMSVVRRFSEIEAELVNGSPSSIEHVDEALRELGATPGTKTPKIMRVVGLPAIPRVEPKAPALEHLRGFVRAQLDELRSNDPIVRATDDADAIHDMRVAVRRLRSVLRPHARCSREPGATASATSSISSGNCSAPFATSTCSWSISTTRRKSSARETATPTRCSRRCDRSEITLGRG